MSGRTLNAMSLLLGLVGLGALGVDQLVGLPRWAQVIAVIATVGMLLWQKLPDTDANGTPDVLEGFWPWFKSRLPWLVLVCAIGLPACPSSTQVAPFKWTSAEVLATADNAAEGVEVSAGVGASFAVFGVPVRVTIQYTDTTIGGCASYADTPPFCHKWPLGDGPAQKLRRS